MHLTIKHQGNNPTGSFKDLGMTACITRAASRGIRRVACASTGNTSSSMAAYAARAGMRALLFVPYRQISAAKLAQALDFGSLVVEVGENFRRAVQAAARDRLRTGSLPGEFREPFPASRARKPSWRRCL